MSPATPSSTTPTSISDPHRVRHTVTVTTTSSARIKHHGRALRLHPAASDRSQGHNSLSRRLCLVGSGSHGSRLTAESSFVRVKGRRERRPGGACPRCAVGRAANNSAEGDDVVERNHIVEGGFPVRGSRASRRRWHCETSRYRRGALQPITSTRKVRPWLPAVAIDVDPRQFLRVSTPRPRPAVAGLLRLGARSLTRFPNNDVRVGRKDQR